MSNQDLGSVLALHGGDKTIKEKFVRYSPIGEEEVNAVSEVVRSGVLSQYLGCWSDDFYGGPKVQEFERQCEAYFGVKHAITVNSWTSGLVAAVGALGVEPGDEVIVSPWTMCASATAILHWNAIPVFADIENDTFCLDPVAVEKCITPRTKAIMAIDIGGQSVDIDALREIADKYGLKIISDTAQAPGALYKGKFAGTLADIGGYSLNYHKHIHTGEGGILVTNDDELADRMRLIRNHAEAVVEDKGVTNLVNMIGHNFRLGEIECAIGIEQLKKLDSLIQSRQVAAKKLSEGLSGLKGLKLPVTREGCTHVYYVYKMMIDPEVTGVSRNKVFDALVAEGVEGLSTKFANLHLLPLYQKKIAYGSSGFPWNSDVSSREVSYEKGICPVAEDLHDRSYLGFLMCLHEMQDSEIELIIRAFKKVWDNLDQLRDD